MTGFELIAGILMVGTIGFASPLMSPNGSRGADNGLTMDRRSSPTSQRRRPGRSSGGCGRGGGRSLLGYELKADIKILVALNIN